jgi:hypothetical protein
MNIISVDQPTFDVKIPSTGDVLKFRPFLVKEQKILLMAFNSDNPNQIYDALKQVINNCCVTENANLDNLFIYDIEYLFLKLRVHSINETLTLYFHPRGGTDCKACNEVREVTINLNEAEMVFPEESVDNVIYLDNTLTKGLKLKQADLSVIENLKNKDSLDDLDIVFEIFWKCIDCIFDGDSVQYTKDIPLEEGVNWLETLPVNVFDDIQKFFDNSPYLKQEVSVKCDECGYTDSYVLRGLDSFFE